MIRPVKNADDFVKDIGISRRPPDIQARRHLVSRGFGDHLI
jgi:hypothetical protein